jgi:hypothetical protein
MPKIQSEWKKLQEKNGDKAKEIDIGIDLKSEGIHKGNQYLPNERHDVIYVSRSECLRAAIDWHLKRLQVQHPKKRVILITFNNEVTIFGDGTSVPEIIGGDKLNNFDFLLDYGKNVKLDLKPICESHQAFAKHMQVMINESTFFFFSFPTNFKFCVSFLCVFRT